VVAGFAAVSVSDILQMFRRRGTGPTNRSLKRLRPLDEEDWFLLPEASASIEASLEDLLIMVDEVRRFETDCDLLRRPAPVDHRSLRCVRQRLERICLCPADRAGPASGNRFFTRYR